MAKRLTVQKSKNRREASLVRVAGRQHGKSSSPDFVKLTSYIRKETHLRIKKRLLDDGRDISELIEVLLSGWLKAGKASN